MIRGVTYYEADCDVCGEQEEFGEYTAMVSEAQAIDCIDESDGIVIDSEHIACADCHSLYHASLEDDEKWDALADRNPDALKAMAAWIDERRAEREAAALKGKQ